MVCRFGQVGTTPSARATFAASGKARFPLEPPRGLWDAAVCVAVEGCMFLCRRESDDLAPKIFLGCLPQPQILIVRRIPLHRLRRLFGRKLNRRAFSAPVPLVSAFRSQRRRTESHVVNIDLVPAFERVQPSGQGFLFGITVKNVVARGAGDDQAQRVFGHRSGSLYCRSCAGECE